MTYSWQNGMAFCALIHYFRPDLIDYFNLDPSNIEINCKIAFDAALKLNIPKIIEPSEMLSVPDKLSVMTFLYQVKAHFTEKKSTYNLEEQKTDHHTFFNSFENSTQKENKNLFHFHAIDKIGHNLNDDAKTAQASFSNFNIDCQKESSLTNFKQIYPMDHFEDHKAINGQEQGELKDRQDKSFLTIQKQFINSSDSVTDENSKIYKNNVHLY